MINRNALITALINDYVLLCHDDPCDDDLTPDAYRAQLDSFTDAQLIEETCIDFDDDYTLADYIQLTSSLHADCYSDALSHPSRTHPLHLTTSIN